MNRMIFDGVLNAVFSPLLGFTPALSIFIIALVYTTFLSIVNKKTIDSKKAKEVLSKMKGVQGLRNEILEAQKSGDTKKANELSKKSMEIQSKYMSEYMKYSFKPLIISFLLALLVLPWVRSTFTNQVVAVVPTLLPVVGGLKLSWLWWFILSSLAISITLRKILE